MMISYTPGMLRIFEGVYPSCLVTSSAEGIPNIANVTRVWKLDDGCLAVANQLFNKTYTNLLEHPWALLKMMNPHDWVHWEITVRYLRSESKGVLFETIKQELHTLSWIAGIPPLAELKSVLVLEPLTVRECEEETFHLRPTPEAYGDLLRVLSAFEGWQQLSYWASAANAGDEVVLKASRGIAGAGSDPSVFDPVKRVAMLALEERRIIRLSNIRSQLRYVRSIRSDINESPASTTHLMPDDTPSSFLAIPVKHHDSVFGVICCEQDGNIPAINEAEDGYLALLGEKLGEGLHHVSGLPEHEREALFRQVVERAKLQWSKEKDPFHTALSPREQQVALHVARGLSNANIAKELFISLRTVTTHLERIYQKLNVVSRTALTRYLLDRGVRSQEDNRFEL